jgi:general secretion pathway protein D
VFTVSSEVRRHIEEWVNRLDQPSKQAAGKNFFTYTARNVSAESLARTLGQIMQGGGGGAAPAAAGVAAAGAAATGAAAAAPPSAAAVAAAGGGRLVVDSNSNTLIFNTSAENFSQLMSLMNTLDQPSKAALIEVTVAEVRLTDDHTFGVEWLLRESGTNWSTTISTLGGLAMGTAGLTWTTLARAGDVRLVLNALASSNRATILSNPRVMARNGETARIQVGQEVPIITSQQSSIDATTGNGTGVLQTVQYRNTGVILSVKPSIFSGDRIDLDIKQEVSAAQSTSTGVNNSPTFLTRNVDTKLTLEHGSTVLLGGLIADDRADSDAGVPWVKNIPIVGQLFRVDTDKIVRTELIVLITPYVVNDGTDARHYTEQYKAMLPMLEPQLAAPLKPGTEPVPGAAPPAAVPATSAPEAAPASPK